MDWVKLIGLSTVVFMAVEIIKVKLSKLKTNVTRILVFVLMVGACAGLAITTPAVIVVKYSFVLNLFLYFVVEYFIYLFLRKELKLSLKNFILSKLGGTTIQKEHK